MQGSLTALIARCGAGLTDPKSLRTWSLAAKDGIIATAGILLGFTGAGASDTTLLMAATASTVVGMLGAGGAEWSAAAAEREAQLSALEEERFDFQIQPTVEFSEIVTYYEGKGLTPDLAIKVASQLIICAPLDAQLESEHGILRLMSRGDVIMSGIGSTIAYALGAAVPFALTFLLPVNIETWLIVAAVFVSLILVSVAGARAGRMDVRNTIRRTLIVGIGTIAISYFVGQAAF